MLVYVCVLRVGVSMYVLFLTPEGPCSMRKCKAGWLASC